MGSASNRGRPAYRGSWDSGFRMGHEPCVGPPVGTGLAVYSISLINRGGANVVGGATPAKIIPGPDSRAGEKCDAQGPAKIMPHVWVGVDHSDEDNCDGCVDREHDDVILMAILA